MMRGRAAWIQTVAPVAKVVTSRPLSVLAASAILVFFAVAALAPLLAPPRPNRDPYLIPTSGFEVEPMPPSASHPFGTTENQFDLYYGLIWGTRTTFKVSVAVIGTSVIVGLILGGAAGYYGGPADEVLMRITDIFLAFPGLVLAVVIVAVLGKGLDKVIIAIAVVNWPTYARLMRAEILTVKEREFVDAARAVGDGTLRVLRKHIVPNAIFSFFVFGSLDIGKVVIVSADLSFLGLWNEIGL